MRAIIPLNVKSLRVSATDASNIVTSFKGRIANFDNIPYEPSQSGSCTGDIAIQLPESDNPPLATLKTGIHLHWELPDYFKKGVQSQTSGSIIFPQAPNRWLVTRYLCKYDEQNSKWLDATNHSWVVESDYLCESQLEDFDGVIRSSIPVPLPLNPDFGEQPFLYMGRAVDASAWPVNNPNDKYLKDFSSLDEEPLYLTALGFLGPSFSTYYPDCCSVFGFCDRFLDDEHVYNALKKGYPIQFKASYHVVGWIDGDDPLDNIDCNITKIYNNYIKGCKDSGEKITETPTDFFTKYASEKFQWSFNEKSVSYKLDKESEITSLTLPQKTICSGIMQEIVWNMLDSPSTSGFLGNPNRPTEPSVWIDDKIKISLGNTSTEALAALLKGDKNEHEEGAQEGYENLLNLLQTGRLDELENDHNILSTLEEYAHSDGFARKQGGLLWIIHQKSSIHNADNPTREINLPLPLAECLSLLNQAQKEYDMGRHSLSVMRKQLYIDWYYYIKLYTEKSKDIDFLNQLVRFLDKQTGFTQYVIDQGDKTGVLTYYGNDNTQDINGVKEPEGIPTSKAYCVWKILESLREKIVSYPEWEMLALPAPCFWLPTDPVSAIEAKSIDCHHRNGTSENIPVRTSPEIISILNFKCGEFSESVSGEEIDISHTINSNILCMEDCRALLMESTMIIPSLALAVARALRSKGGEGNPAVSDFNNFIVSLIRLQGGVSGLESKETPQGVFENIREKNYVAQYNISASVDYPVAMDVIFTNENISAMICDYVGWSVQQQLPQLDSRRYDPFEPLTIIWNLRFEHLKHNSGNQNYSPTNITNYFAFNKHKTDYIYSLDKPFTEKETMGHKGSAMLMKKTIYSITKKIEKYISDNSSDSDNVVMLSKSNELKERHIISQTLNGFSAASALRYYIPHMEVKNLTSGKKDIVTQTIHNVAMNANISDNWYTSGFNINAPISKGELAINNFGTLRSGFLSITSLEVVDIFGQRMQLSTPQLNKDGSLMISPGALISPLPQDADHANKAYLPPRLLPASRLFFCWLSSAWSGSVDGINSEFVEMNQHPTTSPVCGWVLPNNFDNSLFFYDSNGNAIGSFGVEHGGLKYRTRAGNIKNHSDDLSVDIGVSGSPKINKRLAAFMWYIVNKSGDKSFNGGFLTDLMEAIFRSNEFISAENTPRDGALTTLIGRPLAILRCVLGAETAGGLLPLNQANMSYDDPWPQDIINSRCNYRERMKYSASALDIVDFPVRIGDLHNMDDGLVGYIRECKEGDAYGTNNFYAPAASSSGEHGVVAPSDTDILLKFNNPVEIFTLLIDPRAAIHATTGVMPVESLSLPLDQYTEAVHKLQMTIFTHPLLKQKYNFSTPIPEQSGYVWSWVAHRVEAESPLLPMEVSSVTAWGYSPQTIEEGWLKLSVDPNPTPDVEDK